EALKFDAREAYLSEFSDGEEVEAEKVKAIQVAYKESALFEFDLATEGLYEVLVHYQVANANLLPTKVAFSINDEVPYRELKNILFENEWITDEEVSYDRYGNEIAATPRKELKWQEKAVMDGAYRYSDALLLPFREGINTLELSVVEGEIAIASFELRKRNALPSYESQEVSGEEVLVIEGEAIHSRSDSSIRANGEYDVNLFPYSSTKKVLNILDGGSFKKSGQKVSYEVEVKKAGYYYLAMNYRQVDRVDYPVFVDVAINGEIPNEFLKNYPLGYGTKYQRKTLKTANEPIAVYLEEGVSILSLTLSVEPMTASIEKVETVMDEINALALEINKLTGGKADKYRDFDLADYIPGVKENLENWSSRLEEIYQELAVYSQVEGTIGAFSSIKIAMASLDKLAQKPDELPARMNEFSNGTTSVIQYLANTVQVIDNNILSIDRIYLFQEEELLPKEKSIFVKFIEAIKRFFYSFMDQSYSVKNTSEDHLQVWVNRSRQYVEIMQKMVDENFSKET
ncbi:MAG: ABC transporter substrate-binding protein, partial [Vallitaleaceae bacterium]|nr:ABC transporter substrate-binding protein [Vallitaleaceae bacterium]